MNERETNGMDVRDRVRDTVGWVRWHRVELAAVTLPTIAAVTVSPWWVAVTAAVVSRWWWLDRHRDAARRDTTAGDIPRDTARERGTA
ncbi:MAG: hypothetical protein AB7I38_18840 [Dehalococcoidia bacterium]